jgi:FkbM family methyltransferase
MLKKNLQLFRALPANFAARIILFSFVKRLLRIPAIPSFSQCGEDILIRWATAGQLGLSDPGNYVDVGCNLPLTDSNTLDLYLRGWRGINIDANREMIHEFRRVRRQDVSVCAAVSDCEREVTFHKSRTHLVSTIDEKTLTEWKKNWEFRDEDEEKVRTKTLTSILDEHWRYGNTIDVLTIDVEGQDFQVLKGLDFEKYRPKLIVIETYEFDRIRETDIYRFLTAKGYHLRHLAYLNAYFTDGTLTR